MVHAGGDRKKTAKVLKIQNGLQLFQEPSVLIEIYTLEYKHRVVSFRQQSRSLKSVALTKASSMPGGEPLNSQADYLKTVAVGTLSRGYS